MLKKTLFLSIYVIFCVFESALPMEPVSEGEDLGVPVLTTESPKKRSRISDFKASPKKRAKTKKPQFVEFPVAPKLAFEVPIEDEPSVSAVAATRESFDFKAMKQSLSLKSPGKSPKKSSDRKDFRTPTQSPKKSPKIKSPGVRGKFWRGDSSESPSPEKIGSQGKVAVGSSRESSADELSSPLNARRCLDIFDEEFKAKRQVLFLGGGMPQFSPEKPHKAKHEKSTRRKKLKRARPLHEVLEEDVPALQFRYNEAISLIQQNLKEDILLAYDLKDKLLFAKQMEQSGQVQRSALSPDLNSIVLIKDDHICNLIYEEKRRSPGEFHLAGGHFKQEVGDFVLNKVSQLDDEIQDDAEVQIAVSLCEILTSCQLCDISYVHFGVKKYASRERLCFGEDEKFSTTFPESIKPNFYRYIKSLFKVVSGEPNGNVTCLSTTSVGDRISYLLRHNVVYFNEFSESKRFDHDHSVYASMVVFNEEGVSVIWTSYLLGVFVIDWHEIAQEVFNLDSPTVKIYDFQVDKSLIKQKIYAIYCDISSQRSKTERSRGEHERCVALDEDFLLHYRCDQRKVPGARTLSMPLDNVATYNFQDVDGYTYYLIGLENGILLKIRKEDFELAASALARLQPPSQKK